MKSWFRFFAYAVTAWFFLQAIDTLTPGSVAWWFAFMIFAWTTIETIASAAYEAFYQVEKIKEKLE